MSTTVQARFPTFPKNPIKEVSQGSKHLKTERAQTFLISARESVSGLFYNLSVMRVLRGAAANRADLRGRLEEGEIDMLRAAIVFAAAGMDATIKQLIRDALPLIIHVSRTAHDKFTEYVADYLVDSAGAVRGKALAAVLVTDGIRQGLIESYVTFLTGDSLQSVEQLERALGALGVIDPVLRKDVGALRPLFKARNEIVHELDLLHATKPRERDRRGRRLSETADFCNLGLQVTQRVVNAVDAQLVTAPNRGFPK